VVTMLDNRDRVVVIDCQLAGIAGDMLLGALIDLGAEAEKVVDAMESIKGYIEGCDRLEVTVHDVTRRKVQAKKVEVRVEEKIERRAGTELKNALLSCLEHLKFSREAHRFAVSSLEALIKAESKIHGETLERVHLHETGSADTLADIIGVTTALEDLKLFKNTKIYSTPVAVGGGLFKFSHGLASSPAPATLEILRTRNFAFVGGPIDAELTTPTGAALLVNLADEVVRYYPLMKPTVVGYGAGAGDFEEVPNVVRVTLGETYDSTFFMDEVCVLETNLDDVSGEVIGYTVNKMLKEGARDVCVIPMFTKKNRPGHILKVIADKEDVERLAKLLMEETGTLGVRIVPYSRFVLDRQIVLVEVKTGEICGKAAVKVARDRKGRILQIKPEYEDAKCIADKANKPLREILSLIKSRAVEILLEGEVNEKR